MQTLNQSLLTHVRSGRIDEATAMQHSEDKRNLEEELHSH
jgi:Tfp pilus assembly pilus retraction ATPase PilT